MTTINCNNTVYLLFLEVYTWWLDQYSLHNWLEFGFSLGRKAFADNISIRSSAQNSADLLYIAYRRKQVIQHKQPTF